MFCDCMYWNKPVILENTSNIKTAKCMFQSCRELDQKIELDLSSCENISYIFYDCQNLNSPINLKNTKNVKIAENAFEDCFLFNQPIELDFSSCEDISYMFDNCNSLNSKIVLENLDSKKVNYAVSVFHSCDNLNFKNVDDNLIKVIIEKNLEEIKKYNMDIERFLKEEWYIRVKPENIKYLKILFKKNLSKTNFKVKAI